LPSADFFTDVMMLLNIEDRFFNLLQEIITIIVCWVSLRQSNLRWLQVQVLQNIGFFQVIDLDSELELESDSRICLISDKLSTL
jgi:hypothetical protein